MKVISREILTKPLGFSYTHLTTWKSWFSNDFFDSLREVGLLGELQRGESLLFFYWNFESDPFYSPLSLENLEFTEYQLDKYKIPHENFMWMDANGRLDEKIKKLKTKIRVRGFAWDPFQQEASGMFACMIEINKDETIPISDILLPDTGTIWESVELYIQKRRNKHFVCLNKTMFEHRYVPLILYNKFGIQNKMHYSILGGGVTQSSPNGFKEKLYEKYNLTDEDVNIIYPEYPDDEFILLSHGVKTLNLDNHIPNIFGDSYFLIDSLHTYISFYDISFHDKLWKIVSTFHPFIIFGPKGTLKVLRDLGFKTFGKWIDESYDDIYDDIDRFDKTIKLILELSKMSLDKIHEMYLDMSEVLIYNFKRYNELINDTELLKFKDEYIDNPYIKLPVVN